MIGYGSRYMDVREDTQCSQGVCVIGDARSSMDMVESIGI